MKQEKTIENKIRENEIIKLYESGITFREIGEKYGISKQRVWQILKLRWGDYDNRNKKIRNACSSTPSELYVYGRLSVMGFKFMPMPYNHSFDVLIGSKRVEIKYSSKPRTVIISGCPQTRYTFNYLKDLVDVNFYIFVCGDINHNPKCYIYPAEKVSNTKAIPSSFIYKASERKYNKYLENWELLR